MELGNEQRTLHTLTDVPPHELQAFSGMLGNENQMFHSMNGVFGPEPMKMQATEAPEPPQETQGKAAYLVHLKHMLVQLR